MNTLHTHIHTHTEPCSSVLGLGLVLLATLTLTLACNAHAAVRCTNAAGATAYADSAIACPTGYSAAGQVAAMPPVSSQDAAQAKAQAAMDQRTGDALEKQRLAQERAAAKANLAAQRQNAMQAGKIKACKKAELALKQAKDKYDDTPSASVKHPKQAKQQNASKPSKASTAPTHTVSRDGDDKTSKAKKKAKRGVENAQAKRDLVCG